MAKAKFTDTRITDDRKLELTKFFDDTDKYLMKSSNELRSEFEKGTRSSIGHLIKFFTDPGLNAQLSVDVKNAMEHYEAGARDDSVLVSTRLLRESFNDFAAAMHKVAGNSVAHEDFSVIAGHLLVCYTMLVRLKVTKPKDGIPKRGKDPRTYRIKLTDAGWDRQIETFRRLYISASAVAQNPLAGEKGDKSIHTIRKSLNAYFDGLSQTQYELTKNKHVDIALGKVDQKLSYRVQTKENRDAENALGYMNVHLKGGLNKFDKDGVTFRKHFEKMFDDYNDQFMSLVGSKQVGKEVLEQAFDTVKGKKPKKYRSETKKSRQTKAKFKNPIDNRLQKAAAKALAVKAIKKVPKSRRRSGQKDEGSVQLTDQEILKLKRTINRKLPAQIRRNMGRPALINQTGRFSNSVKLESLKRGPNTLIGEYSYQYNPYATFESRGARQWPVGYNPKPLITRSIRDVAIKHTEERFTLRRQ